MQRKKGKEREKRKNRVHLVTMCVRECEVDGEDVQERWQEGGKGDGQGQGQGEGHGVMRVSTI